MSKKARAAEQLLREKGARITPQRVAILSAVSKSGNHPDADAIYRRVSREHPHISRDTVYRTLSSMEKMGIIGAILFVGNSKRYDPNTEIHHHLVCIRCRKVIDFSAPPFDRLKPPPSTTNRFQVLRTTVHVEGICYECRGRTGT
jgi:Fur family transcriptional regulator, peroxide stress response regulator